MKLKQIALGVVVSGMSVALLTNCGGDKHEYEELKFATLSGVAAKGIVKSGAIRGFDARTGEILTDLSVQTTSTGAFNNVEVPRGRTIRVDVTADSDTTVTCDSSQCNGIPFGQDIPTARIGSFRMSSLQHVSDNEASDVVNMNVITTLATNALLDVAENGSADISNETTLQQLQRQSSRVVASSLGVTLSSNNVNVFSIFNQAGNVQGANDSGALNQAGGPGGRDDDYITLTLVNSAIGGLIDDDNDLGSVIDNISNAISNVATSNTTAATDSVTALNVFAANIRNQVSSLVTTVQADPSLAADNAAMTNAQTMVNGTVDVDDLEDAVQSIQDTADGGDGTSSGGSGGSGGSS